MKTKTKDSIDNYVQHGWHPGDFLAAVLCDKLTEAVLRADDDNRHDLVEIVGYLYNDTPRICHGDVDRVTNWLKKGGLKGMPEMVQACAQIKGR